MPDADARVVDAGDGLESDGRHPAQQPPDVDGFAEPLPRGSLRIVLPGFVGHDASLPMSHLHGD